MFPVHQHQHQHQQQHSVRPHAPRARRAAAIAALAVAAVAVATGPVIAQAPSGGAPPDTVAAALRTLVLRTSPEIAARRAALRAAEARARAAGYAPPAALSAEAEGIPGGVDLTRAQSVRVQAEREFLSGGRRAAARALAATDVGAAAASLTLAEQRVAAAVDRALVALIGWRAVGRRLVDEDSLLASAEVSLRTRFAVGGARYVDVLRLRTERLRAQSERAAALTGALAAVRGLEALVPDSATLATARALAEAAATAGPTQSAFAALPPAPSVDSLLAASGTARLADLAVTRATAAQRLALAERRPQLTGFAGVQRFAGAQGYPVGPVVGAAVTLPFTARRATRALAGAAAEDVVAATAERRASLQALRAGLLAARDRYEAARARIGVFDAALLRGARDERESALAAYRGGELSLLELLDFERALARAEVERLRNRIDAADALADLLGGAVGGAADTSSPTHDAGTDDR